jgi:hypothetical protein
MADEQNVAGVAQVAKKGRKNTVTVGADGQPKVLVAERNAAIPMNVFLPKLHELAAKGLTQKEIANALGMKETSLSVRLTQIRKMTDKAGNVIGPSLLPEFKGGAKGRKNDLGEMLALVEAAKAKIAADKATTEGQVETTEAAQG